MPPPIRKCSRDCPREHCHKDLTWYCFSCQEPIHLLCYGLVKKPEEIFLNDNITMVCDECLANPKRDSSPKRKQSNGSGKLVQRTFDVQNSNFVLLKSSPVNATPPKGTSSNQNQQIQTVIDALVQKIDTQTSTLADLQVSVDTMKGAVQKNTAVIVESIKESRATYADIAKKGVTPIETPRSTKHLNAPKKSSSTLTPKNSKPLIAGTSTKTIGKPLSPPKVTRSSRSKPEKAVWISRLHRDTTEIELTNYINESIGISPADFDVRKLVKKDRDINTYSYVSFYVACTQANFNTLMNPMYWPSNSQIREFELDKQSSIVVKLSQSTEPKDRREEAPKNYHGLPNNNVDNHLPQESSMDTDQVNH